MSQYLGLDPAAVRQLAQQMRSAAGEIQNLSQQINSQLQNTPWTGPDREAFLGEWQSAHMSQLHTVVSALEQAASTAQRNAEQQEQVSQS